MSKKDIKVCEKKHSNNVSRRNFLKKAGITAISAGLLCSTGGLLTGCGAATESKNTASATNQSDVAPDWPYSYVKLDPEKVAERTFEAYKEGG